MNQQRCRRVRQYYALLLFAIMIMSIKHCVCWHFGPSVIRQSKIPLFAKKGFDSSGAGFGVKKAKVPSKKSALKTLENTYGGTSTQDIARGTQQRIESAIKSLPPHLQMATQIYQQLRRWDAQLENLSILQQANLSPQEMEGAKRAQEELERLYREHNFSENDLHNIFQKITWDASADAKAARAITGDMPKEIQARVERGCRIVAEAASSGRCLDVGCGFGVLVPFLEKTGLRQSQIHGVDLSTEMIRNARERFPKVSFSAVDFLNEYEDDDGFDAIIFCSSLHDMPDQAAALKKAVTLLRKNGKLVVLHPQGASHVLGQMRSNPIMVKRGLPNVEELRSMDLGVEILVEPVGANSDAEAMEGYLFVLKKQ